MAALALDQLRTPWPEDGQRRATLVLVEPPAGDALVEFDGVPANDGQYPARPTYHYDPAPRKIRYEEYHPYGTSAYRAVDASVDVSAKRYRYTGMERDEETGLGYHSARYYAPWLGRWTSADPIGLGDGVNRYAYAGNAGVGTVDRSGNSGVTVVAGAAPEYEGSSAPGNWEPIASTVDAEGNAATEWLWIEAGSAEEASVAARDARERPKQGRTSPAAAMKGGSAGADGGIDWGRVARATPHAFVLGQGVGFLKGSWNTATALPKLGVGLIGDYDGTVSGLKQTWREDGLLGFTPFGELGDKIVETGVQLGEGNLYAAGEAWGEGAVAAQNSAATLYGAGLFARWSVGKLFSRHAPPPRGMIDEAAGGEFLDDAIRGPGVAHRGVVTGDPGVILAKARAAQAGDLSAAAELRAAKLLRNEGQSVHFVAETPAAKTADFLVNGVATDVKRIGGLGKNAAKDLAKGVAQVGPGGQVLVVRPSSAIQTLATYRDFVSGFKPKQPGVTFRVVDEASLPRLNFGPR